MKVLLRLFPGIVLTLLLAACTLPMVGVRDPGMAQHRYILEWSPTQAARVPSRKAPSLLVSPVRARPPYSSSDMLYMSRANELNTFAYHSWADSPAHMLEPLMVLSAEHSGLFRLVAPAGNPVVTDLRLDSWLLHLRQVFEAEQCRVELAIRIELNDVTNANPLGSHLFDYREPCDAASPQGGMATANRVVARFLADMPATLQEMLPR